MLAMYKLLRLIVLLIPIALANGQLSGRWRSSDVSSAGLRTVFDFHGDNQLDSYAAAISEERYRLIGTDTILIQSNGGREEKQELEWDNEDKARIEDEAAGKSIELTRLDKSRDKKNPLAGEWSTTREWNGRKYPAHASFSAGGRVIWMIAIRAEHGTYSMDSKTIRLEIPGRPVVEGSLAGDRLTLANPGGGESIFERF
jgi:hypothetical protein